MASGRAEAAVFDTLCDDDLLFGSGSGCRGRMRVLAWPVVADRAQPLLDALLAAQAAGQALELAVQVDADAPGAGLAWFDHERFSLGATPDPGWMASRSGLHVTGGRTIARLQVRPSPR